MKKTITVRKSAPFWRFWNREDDVLEQPLLESFWVYAATGAGDGSWIEYKLADKDRGGWVVLNSIGDQYRTWKNGIPAWTADPQKAIRYYRRKDAETAHQEDNDAWSIVKYEEVA